MTVLDDPIYQAQQRIDTALGQFDQASAALLGQDGKPIYTDHQQRLTALQAQLGEQLTVVEAQIGQARTAAQEAATRAAGTDLVDILTPEELAPAASRRAFVEEDAAALGAPALVVRLRAVAAGTDRVLQLLWLRAAGQRLRAHQEEGRRPGARHTSAPDSAAFAEITQLTRELESRLTPPSWAAEREAAQARLKSVQALQIQLHQARQRVQPGRRTRVQL